jgi:hypothetical protein
MKNMKKYIKQIFALALIVSFASCSPDDEKVEMLSAGGSAAVPGSISRLDTNVPITINLKLKEGVTATKVEIYKNTAASSTAAIVLGAKVADATIVTVDNTKTTATYSSAALGSFDTFPTASAGNTGKTGTFALAIVSTFSDGTVTTIPYVQTVAKGIVWKDADAATTSTSGVTSFLLDDPTPVEIRYAVVKKTATTIASVIGEWSKDGVTYAALPGTFSTVKQTIDIAAIPYSTYGGLAVDDVLYYKFTVTTSTGQKDFITTKVTIATQDLGDEATATLSDDLTANKFSLKTGLNYANTDMTHGEILFTTPFGISKEGTTVIDFVKSNATDYDAADLFIVRDDYEAGVKVTSLIGLTKDDVVLYKIVRGTGATAVTSYGIIKVGDVNTTTVNTDTTNSFGIVYKEGSFM